MTHDRIAPAEFSGRISSGPQTQPGTEESVGGHTEVRGAVFAPTVVQMSDPRLEGTMTLTSDRDAFPVPGTDADVTLRTRTWRIENEAGAWEGSDFLLSLSDGSVSTTSGALTGEGAYAGLVAAWEVVPAAEGWDVRGFIVPGEMPPGE